jgi:hypothetical protein
MDPFNLPPIVNEHDESLELAINYVDMILKNISQLNYDYDYDFDFDRIDLIIRKHHDILIKEAIKKVIKTTPRIKRFAVKQKTIARWNALVDVASSEWTKKYSE